MTPQCYRISRGGLRDVYGLHHVSRANRGGIPQVGRGHPGRLASVGPRPHRRGVQRRVDVRDVVFGLHDLPVLRRHAEAGPGRRLGLQHHRWPQPKVQHLKAHGNLHQCESWYLFDARRHALVCLCPPATIHGIYRQSYLINSQLEILRKYVNERNEVQDCASWNQKSFSRCEETPDLHISYSSNCPADVHE